MELKCDCIETLKKRGFTEEFKAGSAFCIVCNNLKRYKPHQVKISAFYKCTCNANKTKSSVLYAIETNDGKKGILIASEENNLDDKISEFIHVVNVARKQSKTFKFIRAVKWLLRSKFAAYP